MRQLFHAVKVSVNFRVVADEQQGGTVFTADFFHQLQSLLVRLPRLVRERAELD